jgi:hypothetical protein
MKVAITIIAILWVAAATYGEYVGWQGRKLAPSRNRRT